MEESEQKILEDLAAPATSGSGGRDRGGHTLPVSCSDFEDDSDRDRVDEICPSCGAGPDEECEVDCDCNECEGIEALAAITGGALVGILFGVLCAWISSYYAAGIPSEWPR